MIVIVGYNDFSFDMTMMMMGNIQDGTSRDMRMNYIQYGNKKLPYMEVLNKFLLEKSNPKVDKSKYLHCGKIPNLGAVYLKNFLEKKDIHCEIVNLYQFDKSIFKKLLASKPEAVVISTTLYTTPYPIMEIVDFVKKNNKDTKIIIGGPYVYLQQKQLKEEEFQLLIKSLKGDIYVIESQGENTLHEVIQSIEGKKDLSDIKNIYYKATSNYSYTGERQENNSLDDNIINWDAFSDEFLGDTVQTRTARSCPFSCSFCSYPARAGKHVQTSLLKVEEELRQIDSRGNIKSVLFIDDTFNVPIDRFKEFLKMLIRNKFKFKWYSYLRCQFMDEESVVLMKKSNCGGVFLGLESGDQRMLDTMNKKVTVEKYVNGLSLLNTHGIMSFACFMTGFPGETKESIDNTIKLIEKAKPTFFRAMLWYHDAVTPIHEQREIYGLEGDKFGWKHNTMDNVQACDEIDRIFLTVKNSIWMPQYNFDFWSIPYILGKGLSLGQLKEVLIITNNLLKTQLVSKDKTILAEAEDSFEIEMLKFCSNVVLHESFSE